VSEENTELDGIYSNTSYNQMTPVSDLLSYDLSSPEDEIDLENENGNEPLPKPQPPIHADIEEEENMFTLSPNINLVVSPS
jgi:hypothetical protein